MITPLTKQWLLVYTPENHYTEYSKMSIVRNNTVVATSDTYTVFQSDSQQECEDLIAELGLTPAPI
tara:strand:+ start:14830 stop:15027 length:198 start_codon:yes stop_codon:yes gene_type:complete